MGARVSQVRWAVRSMAVGTRRPKSGGLFGKVDVCTRGTNVTSKTRVTPEPLGHSRRSTPERGKDGSDRGVGVSGVEGSVRHKGRVSRISIKQTKLPNALREPSEVKLKGTKLLPYPRRRWVLFYLSQYSKSSSVRFTPRVTDRVCAEESGSRGTGPRRHNRTRRCLQRDQGSAPTAPGRATEGREDQRRSYVLKSS